MGTATAQGQAGAPAGVTFEMHGQGSRGGARWRVLVDGQRVEGVEIRAKGFGGARVVGLAGIHDGTLEQVQAEVRARLAPGG